MQSIYCKHILQKKSSSTVVQCRLISTIIAIESTITIQYIKTTCLHIILILTLFASFSGKCANQTKMPTCGSWFWKLHHLHVFLVRPPRARSSSVPTKSLQSRRSATRLDASQVSFCFCVAFFLREEQKGKIMLPKKSEFSINHFGVYRFTLFTSHFRRGIFVFSIRVREWILIETLGTVYKTNNLFLLSSWFHMNY